MIWVDGPDAEHFLHGLLSNDVAALDAGADCPALLLDDKGHLKAMLIVHRSGPDEFTLLTDPRRAAETVELLHQFHFSEALDITGPEMSHAVLITDAFPAPEGTELLVQGWAPGTRLALLPEPWGDGGTNHNLAERVRIEAGIPRVGIDTEEKTLPHEIGLVSTFVSFDKGCYLGQETVARVEYRGGVRRHLRGVRSASLLEVGTDLVREGASIGRVSSAAVSPRFGNIGLAILRDGEGAAATADGEAVEILPLPFGADASD